jgi:hypothetical protein
MVRDLFFWDHEFKEGGVEASKSRYNSEEVHMCIGLAR